MHVPIADTLLGWCWLTFALAMRGMESNLDAVRRIVGIVFLISFAAPALTLGLVYGDPVQRAAHRRFCPWAPARSTPSRCCSGALHVLYDG